MRYVLLLLCGLSLAGAQHLLRPFEHQHTAMVPVVYVAEWLGATVTPEPATGSVVVRLGEKTVTWSARADGAATHPYPAPVMEGGILYVPARAFAVEFGVTVKRVDGHSELVELTNPASLLDSLDLPLMPKGMAFTPLQLDLLDFRLTAARKRLATGIDVNQRDGKGMTALHVAVELRQFQIIDELVGKGANINLAGAGGRTALHRLLAPELLFTTYSRYAEQSHLFYRNEVQTVDKIFAQLLKLKANVNLADAGGATPLHLVAVWARTPEYIDALCRAGANTNLKDKRGRTPLQYAVYPNPYSFDDVSQKVVATFLAHGAKPTLVSPRGWTLMHYAAMWNDAALVAVLKKQGLASTTPETSAGWTPLHVAARFCTLDAAKALLAVGASVSAKDATGGTPLHLAAEMGHATAITLLLGKNASPAAVNTRGMTPLHVALLARRVDTVKQLLAAGGTLNYRVDGWTPLMVAVNGNDLPMVKFLLSKSVDVNAATGPKFGALYFKDGNLGAEKVYRTVPFGDMTALHVAAISDQRVEVARALLTAKTIKIDAPARNGYTPLHYAAAVGSAKIAKLLLTSTPRAAVNAKTKEGKTPLALAIANKWPATAAVVKGYGGK